MVDISQYVVLFNDLVVQLIGFLIDSALFGAGFGAFGVVNGLIESWFAL